MDAKLRTGKRSNIRDDLGRREVHSGSEKSALGCDAI